MKTEMKTTLAIWPKGRWKKQWFPKCFLTQASLKRCPHVRSSERLT